MDIRTAPYDDDVKCDVVTNRHAYVERMAKDVTVDGWKIDKSGISY